MAIGTIQAGARQVDVDKSFNVSQSVVPRLVNRFNETGNVAERLKSGRSRVTTPTQHRYITLSAQRTPLDTCRILNRRFFNVTRTAISVATIRRRLSEVNFKVSFKKSSTHRRAQTLKASLGSGTSKLAGGMEICIFY
uniref:Uncharacterized protein LOC114331772 n=1 Tax=Diabrotica virgifera virgifera TaxID=50390 RepID=A0A6P7FMB9_DIAVI